MMGTERLTDKIKCFNLHALPASDYVKGKAGTELDYLCHYMFREGCKYAHLKKDHYFCSVNTRLVLMDLEGNEI